jgi:dTDP-4-amino-4,6-dideoxygalactose transaminase
MLSAANVLAYHWAVPTLRRVPLLDLTLQYASIQAEIRAALDRVCDSQQFILGAEVAALEDELAAFCGTQFAVGVSSGTDALLAALMALDIGAGDEVIVPAYSFFATAGTVVRLGARPVFVDVEAESFNIDASAVADAITSRTRAIVPVHLFGRCAEMAAIHRAAGPRHIVLIEDAAQGIGARDATGRPAGTLGAMGCFSFYPTKNLGAFGDAGMLITDDEDLDRRLRILRVHGETAKYEHALVGGNFRLDALQAAVLRVKLKHLAGWNSARDANAERYRRLFAEACLGERVRLPAHVAGHVYNQFVVLVDDRDELRAFLQARSVGTEIYYPIPLHLQPCFRDLGHKAGDFPAAEWAARHCLALPIYPELTAAQQQYVTETIAAFYRR